MTTTKQTVGKYEIERKIGEGGFGIVYQARDTVLERTVALKQLKLELSSSPEYLSRFKRESRLMGSLTHNNIVRVLDVFEDGGRYFIVMDYLPNGSLADKLKDGKPLPLEQAIEILKPIARAIDYAHGKNLIHRDIKPSNILFTEEDEPVLSDFGLVKSLDTSGLTSTGSSLGTPEYMAPEQILCKELTPAADTYAFGVVAYQMLAGEVPFTGNTPFEIQEGHVHKEPPDILNKNPELPEEFSEIFQCILAKDITQRSPSAKDFVKELNKIYDSQLLERNQEKLEQARGLMAEKDFTKATVILNKLFATKPDAELQDLLDTCKHREQVWKDYKQLIDQTQALSDALESNEKRIKDLKDSENWIMHDELKDKGVDLDRKKEEHYQVIENLTKTQKNVLITVIVLALLAFIIIVASLS
jgi:serine/threonine-protein kinase